MRTIWKFEIKVEDRVEIEMPRQAELLQLQVQNGVPVLWAIVVPDRVTERRRFRVFGTGHPLVASDALDNASRLDMDVGDRDDYIGTFQLGDFVGHVFEETP